MGHSIVFTENEWRKNDFETFDIVALHKTIRMHLKEVCLSYDII
jgi:hypothetical protein